jgi:hypothetical protein
MVFPTVRGQGITSLLCSVFIFAARWHCICGRGLNYVRHWLIGLKRIFNRSLEVLAALMENLPHVPRWLHALQKIAVHFNEEGILTAMVTCNPKGVSPPQPLQLCNSGHPIFLEKEHSLKIVLTSGLARQIPPVANESQISNQSRLESSQQFDTIGQFTNTKLLGIGGDDMSWSERLILDLDLQIPLVGLAALTLFLVTVTMRSQ